MLSQEVHLYPVSEYTGRMATSTQNLSITSALARYADGQITLKDVKNITKNILEKQGASEEAIRWVLSRKDIFKVQPPYNRYTAEYIKNATRRLDREETTPDTEFRYYKLHRKANKGRKQARDQLQRNTLKYGSLLGWYAREDPNTTPECRWRDGRNFHVYRPPHGQLPGLATHYGCRCVSGKPHENAPTMGPRSGPK